MKTRTKHLIGFILISLMLIWGLLGVGFYLTPEFSWLYWILGAFWTVITIAIAIDETSNVN